MKVGVLFSGGKDSVYATYFARRAGFDVGCLISVVSGNKNSFMFHTPSISQTKKQAEVMGFPIVVGETKGEKEVELKDLREIIKSAKEEYGLDGVVTGAVHSVYQASRIQTICYELGLQCFNPLWLRDEEKYLEELLKNNFKVILTGVFAYPFDESWVLREIDEKFTREIKELKKKYKIHVAGEGGEFETLVLNCPIYERELEVVDKEIIKEGENSFRSEVVLK